MRSDLPQSIDLVARFAEMEKRVLDLERQVSSIPEPPRILDDLDDCEVLYDDTSLQPDGTTVAPVDGDLLTYDASRSLWVPDQPSFAIGPVLCNRYTGNGYGTWSDTDIFESEDPTALWLIHVQVDSTNGVTDQQVYIDVYDDGAYYVAADRTTTGPYTSYDMASVSFPWWPPPDGTGLYVEVGVHTVGGAAEDFRVTIRAVRLGDAPDVECGTTGGG